MLDAGRRARRIARIVRNLTPRQWLIIAAVIAVVFFASYAACSARRDARSARQQTQRDEQHNANVTADIRAADANHDKAETHEADRREAEGRYQESERAVERARGRAEQARSKDEEATHRHEETRRTSTSDMPEYSDDDVCAKLRSANVTARGCKEQ